ncbi:MAG: 30S ribosomal protein S19 [Planctomycetota bacterium]|nr:MAG: 30S ribosomal protein S19 [Planctomycetota bacterium]
MGRSIKKGPFVEPKLAKKVAKMAKTGKRDPITTWSRRCTIPPDFIGHVFMVHNGRMHLKVQVTEDMVGHKLGEFAPTRVFRGHTNKKEEAKPGAEAS